MADIYSTMYKLSVALIINDHIIDLPASDVVSIAMVHRYDTATYPIIRFRIQADLSVVQEINESPDNLQIKGNLDAGVYKMNQDTKETTLVAPATSISLQMKGYIENKNIPTSKIETYQVDTSNSGDPLLNASKKIQFEIYGYNDKQIHQMRQRAQSIYRNVSLETVIQDIFRRCGVMDIQMDPIENQKRYDQILIPNLSAIDAFSYFDRYYGIYTYGGLLYGDIDKMYLCSTIANNGTLTVPIYVKGDKQNTDISGMFYTDAGYKMQTTTPSVSVISETDIERILNPEIMSDVNIMTLISNHAPLTRLFDTTDIDTVANKIEQTNILHKMDRTNISIQQAARLNEQITRIDLSGSGFDVGLFHPNTRFNIVFETPIRGMNISDAYRAKYIINVFTNTTGDLMTATTTMQLCTN